MKEKILEILQDIRPEVDFNDSEDFIDDGFIDSFDIVALVAKINNEFNVNIRHDDILPENFNTIEAIEAIINKYK